MSLDDTAGLIGIALVVGLLIVVIGGVLWLRTNDDDPLYVDGTLLSVDCEVHYAYLGRSPVTFTIHIEKSAETTMTGIIGMDKTFDVTDEQCPVLSAYVGKEVRVFDDRGEWGWNWADRVELLEGHT